MYLRKGIPIHEFSIYEKKFIQNYRVNIYNSRLFSKLQPAI
jgi:hypothetical protein